MSKSEDSIKSLKVLVVDDQIEIRTMLRGMLSELGITQIFEAADGKEAMVFTDNAMDMIDVVICDWNMPKLSGIDLLRQMRSVYPDVPFLMITGRSDVESVSMAKASGVTAYIRKPFSPAHLEVKLRVIKSKMDSKHIA
ncbi:MAG TPA: response regulator [Alphaproteobacteria bacterium]|jgi:two-component system chemotaxis response regulator CheY|nr:response regulator [Alphaproteobacteria bacterium]MCB9984347.1 response regulator [Micavibrio sp.]HRK97887.1 response regulator [Alphaproteobacteria bacterium]